MTTTTTELPASPQIKSDLVVARIAHRVPSLDRIGDFLGGNVGEQTIEHDANVAVSEIRTALHHAITTGDHPL
ncbi:MAG: hypothetical protein H0V17_09730 [Deltaproteobacteria bacterium]|nr:hypothetical protein [Deltaproteobacteria bacterium]